MMMLRFAGTRGRSRIGSLSYNAQTEHCSQQEDESCHSLLELRLILSCILRLPVNRFASVLQPGEEEEVSKILAVPAFQITRPVRKSSASLARHSERDLSLPPALRSIPRALRPKTTVVGFMPSKVAAPVRPKIFRRSDSGRPSNLALALLEFDVGQNRGDAAGAVGAIGSGCAPLSQSNCNAPPWARMTARSMAFCSSRTLPGHSYEVSWSIAARVS